MGNRLLVLAQGLGLVLLSGCSATGDMKVLLERGEYEQAGTWYLERQLELQKDTDAPPLVERVVSGMAPRFADQSSPLGARLAAVNARTGPGQWGLVRADLGEARRLLERYARYAALRDGSALARNYQALAEAERGAEATLRRYAADQFARYDHQGDFFQEYPIRLSDAEREAVLAKGFSGLLKTLEAADGAATLRIVEAYAPIVTGVERQSQFVTAYEKAIINGRGWREPLDFAQTLALVEQVKSSPVAGFKSVRPVVAVELQAACIDTAVEWGLAELPINTRKIAFEALPETLKALRQEGVRHVAVAVPDCILVSEAVVRVDKRRAKKIGAMRTVPNPAYPSAVEAVKEAADSLRTAKIAAEAARIANANRSRSGSSWMNLLVDLAVDGGGAMAVGSYEADLAQKQAALQAMPTTIQVPVYHYYQTPISTYERVRQHQVDIYLADLAADRVEHFRLSDRIAVTAVEAYDVDNTDPDKTVVAVENERRRDILDSIDRQPLSLTASRSFSDLSAKKGRAAGSVDGLPELVRGNIEAWKKNSEADQQKAIAAVALLPTQLSALRDRIASEGAQGEAPDGKPMRSAAVPAIASSVVVSARHVAPPIVAPAPVTAGAVPPATIDATVIATPPPPSSPPVTPVPKQRIYPSW